MNPREFRKWRSTVSTIFTLLGWDQNALSCESLSPKETANVRRVLSFGRPL